MVENGLAVHICCHTVRHHSWVNARFDTSGDNEHHVELVRVLILHTLGKHIHVVFAGAVRLKAPHLHESQLRCQIDHCSSLLSCKQFRKQEHRHVCNRIDIDIDTGVDITDAQFIQTPIHDQSDIIDEHADINVIKFVLEESLEVLGTLFCLQGREIKDDHSCLDTSHGLDFLGDSLSFSRVPRHERDVKAFFSELDAVLFTNTV